MKIELFEEILSKASLVYGMNFDSPKPYCGALVINVVLTFWWGLMQYFKAETEERRQFFLDWIPKRVQGIRFLCQLIDKKF